jgi:GTP-binding protein
MEEMTEWWVHGKSFPILMVDTGGLGGELFVAEIEKQVKTALEKADLVLFVFDSQVGLTPMDQELFRQLSQSGLRKKVPVLGIVNKVDAEMHEDRIAEFFELGLDQVLTLSAEHNRGIDDLKLCIFNTLGDTLSFSKEELSETTLQEEEESEDESTPEAEEPSVDRIPRIAIVGRPNVGKSTLVNALLREDRMITSSIAGTTVDSIDSVAELNGKPFIFIDTAGIRRKSKTEQGVEVLSVVQSKKALDRADIAILVLDGETGITDQDEKIGGLIEEVGCSVILAVNKWDTQERNKDFPRDVAAEQVRKTMAFLKYAPIVFMSAKKGKGLENLGELFEEILHQRRLKLATHEFTEWVREKSTIHNPMNAKFFLCHQTSRNPPTFVCHVNDPEKIHFSLRRHFINALREKWGFMGTPIRMLFIEGKNRRSLPKPVKNKKLPRKENIS